MGMPWIWDTIHEITMRDPTTGYTVTASISSRYNYRSVRTILGSILDGRMDEVPPDFNYNMRRQEAR